MKSVFAAWCDLQSVLSCWEITTLRNSTNCKQWLVKEIRRVLKLKESFISTSFNHIILIRLLFFLPQVASAIHLYGQKYVSEKSVSHPKSKLKTSRVYFEAITYWRIWFKITWKYLQKICRLKALKAINSCFFPSSAIQEIQKNNCNRWKKFKCKVNSNDMFLIITYEPCFSLWPPQ